MNLNVSLLPIFDDNYVFVTCRNGGNRCFAVDPGEAEATIQFIESEEIYLELILLTHHHSDHIGGALKLKQHFEEKQGSKVEIIAPLNNRKQINFADRYVAEAEKLELLGENWEVIELPGHTLGHVAYYCRNENILFSGDVLFGLGCGRLFEGSFEQGWQSLQRIAGLPSETRVYCTHEYTLQNLKFCNSLHYDVADYAIRLQKISVPLLLQNELKFNPFLRADSVAEFKKAREARNVFKG